MWVIRIAWAIAPTLLGASALVLFATVPSRPPLSRPTAVDMADVALRVAALQLALLFVAATAGLAGDRAEPGNREDLLVPGRTNLRTRLGSPMAAVMLLLTNSLPVLAAVFLYAGLDLGGLARAEAVTVVTTLALVLVVTALNAVLHRPRVVAVVTVASAMALFVAVGLAGEDVVLDHRSDAVIPESAATEPEPTQPGGSRVGVTVKAAPRWRVSTPGSITPYLITLKSTSPIDLSGEVVLIPAASPPAGGLGTPLNGPGAPNGSSPEPEPAKQRPAELSPVEVLALGQTEFTVAPATLAEAAPGDHLTYRAPVTLAGDGAEKSITLLVVEAPFGYRAELRDESGGVVAVSSPSATPARPLDPRYAVALLSRVPRADATLGWLGEFFGPRAGPDFAGPRAGTVTPLPSARDVPESALLLSGLQSIVIAGFDTTELNPSQLRALQDFVALGGSLVLGGGAAAKRELAPLPDELVPLKPSGTGTASLARLADLVGRTTSATTTVVTGDLRSGRPVMTTGDGVPLVVQADYGAGRVVQLAYDPLSEPFPSDTALRDLAWQQGIGRALAPTDPAASRVAPPEQLWDQALVQPPWPRWPRWGLALVVLSTVLVGTIGLGGFRARRRTGLRAAAAPVAAVVFTAAICIVGMSREGAVTPVVEVSTSTPAGTTMSVSYGGFQSVGGWQRRVVAAPGAVVSSVFSVPSPLAPGVAVVSSPGTGGGVVTAAGGAAHLEVQTEPGGVRNIQEYSLVRRPGLDAQLRLTGAGPPEQGNLRVAGTVTNLATAPLRQLRAQLPEGALARIADEIRPGATIEVDAPFVWPGGINAGSGVTAPSSDLVMFAAASRAFTRSGQVALVGLVQPGTTDSGAIGVQVQVVPLTATENLVAATGRSRLVSRVREPSGALIRVLDLGGVPGVGPVDLVFNAYQPAPEVFDWAGGTWRTVPLPDGFERHVPLAASEVRDGLVRMRWADVGETGGAGYRLALRR